MNAEQKQRDDSESRDDSPRSAGNDIPTSLVRDAGRWGRWLHRSTIWLWLITLACLLLAVTLALRSVTGRGPVISVRFSDGFGLKAEDAVRFRGIEVGQVQQVRLRDDLQGVDVQIRLRPDAKALAREGSQFWVERPQLSLSRMSGLETVLGAKFVGVIPGPRDSRSARVFEGIDQPPRLRQISGVTVLVHFTDGHGIAAGDVVKYRGITVGEVIDVRLDDDLRGVDVEARLMDSAHSLARAGTTYWVERPNVSLRGVRGLETLVGGHYLAAMPDPEPGEPQAEFQGADEPPASLDPVDGGLPVTLVAEQRLGLERGVSVTYRGMPAGQVTWVGLASSTHAVEVRVVIFPEYEALVRRNTKFWSKSGVDFHLGLRGLDMDVEPLASLTEGRIAFATPDPAGQLVPPGHRFQLANEEAEGWQEWKPAIELRQPQGKRSPDSPSARRRIMDRLRKPFGGSDEDQDPSL